MLDKLDAREAIATYIQAWERQEPDLIVTVFTPDATYHERVMGDPMVGRKAIRQYWVDKVVNGQANIRCDLLSLYVDGDTAIAEWLAEFDDVAQGVRKQMKEIAVLEFDGRQIASLREYWASKTLPVRERGNTAAEDWGLALAGDHTEVRE
jgi:ketosteroid isomerase-like protein